MTLHSLETFSISSPVLPIPTFASVIQHSKFTLKHLSLVLHDGHGDIDDTGVDSLSEDLPSLTRLDLSWIIPPTVFRKMQKGISPLLIRVELFVHPEGLEAFLDFINSYTSQPVSQRRPLSHLEIS